jgi:DNA polymerase III epsilon subunit-like protein
MIVVDVETTGTEPDKHSVLSIGAVDFGNPDAQFYGECRIWDGAHVDPVALTINGMTEAQVRDPNKKTEGEIIKDFFTWVEDREEFTVAGQNPLFDLGFIKAGAYRNHINYTLAHRSIDQHSLVYFHMIRRGLTPPVHNKHSGLDSDTIMAYVGIPAEPKPHIALNGAKWEAEVFSRLLHEKPLFTEFKGYKIPWIS